MPHRPGRLQRRLPPAPRPHLSRGLQRGPRRLLRSHRPGGQDAAARPPRAGGAFAAAPGAVLDPGGLTPAAAAPGWAGVAAAGATRLSYRAGRSADGKAAEKG
ncbi:hypothetical protein HF200_06965, partial [Streptomyces galbus]|nr:hypothetical protein [Streptomyces galbus]